jgi:exopolysaccharide biosynthesis protein
MLNRKKNKSILMSLLLNHLVLLIIGLFPFVSSAQLKWNNVSEQFGNLPASVEVYKTFDQLSGRPNIAFYVEIDTKDKNLAFEVDTTLYRRQTPQHFFKRNNDPYIVMNCSFFEFKQNRNVNLIMQDSKMVAFDTPVVSRKGKDTLTYLHTLGSAFGMNKRSRMDIVYQFNDSALKYPLYQTSPMKPFIDSFQQVSLRHPNLKIMKPWKVQWAFGGGPVLLLDKEIKITNNEERKFAGKAIDDLHPRTAIGYTATGKMILLVVQGRMPGVAAGASLRDLASIMKDLGCAEALNLDGGGSSTLLVNGLETIKPSDPGGQRPVPAVFIVKKK